MEGIPIKAHEHGGPPIFTPDWLAEQVLRAYGELGEPFFTSDYIKWVREKRRDTDDDFPPPDYSTLIRHGGSWPEIREQVRVAAASGNLDSLLDQLKVGGMNA